MALWLLSEMNWKLSDDYTLALQRFSTSASRRKERLRYECATRHEIGEEEETVSLDRSADRGSENVLVEMSPGKPGGVAEPGAGSGCLPACTAAGKGVEVVSHHTWSEQRQLNEIAAIGVKIEQAPLG
jgi:hypothetical protein